MIKNLRIVSRVFLFITIISDEKKWTTARGKYLDCNRNALLMIRGTKYKTTLGVNSELNMFKCLDIKGGTNVLGFPRRNTLCKINLKYRK